MRRVVLHPSAAEWFEVGGSPPLRREFEACTLEVIVPPSFRADAVSELASRGWSRKRLVDAGAAIGQIGFRVKEPPVSDLADWLTRGVPTPAAAYAALSSADDVPIAVSHPKLRDALKILPQVD